MIWIFVHSGLFLPSFDACARQQDNPAPVSIPAGADQVDLSGHLKILKDTAHIRTIEQVISAPVSEAFLPAGPGVPHLGLTDAAVWVCFVFEGRLPDGWVLHAGWPYLATLRLRQLRENPGEMVLGRSPGDRTFEAWAFADEKSGSWTIYARFISQGVLTLPMKLYTDGAFLSYQRATATGYGIYYGIILAMAMYNLFLFFSLRDKAYLYYVLYMFCVLFYFFGLNGLTLEYLFAGRRALDTRITLFFLSLVFITAGVFTRYFLETRKNAPRMDVIICALIVLGAVLAGLSFLLRFSLLATFFSILGTAAPFVLIAAAVMVWRQGFGPARYYLLAWSIYAAGTLVFALTYSGVISFTTMGFHSYQIGSAVEAVLLSFALAHRIRVLRREREEAVGNERRAMDLALTDALTGLNNSRFFRAHIGPEIQKAENLGQPLSLLMLDVDDFKQFNDQYGHIQGDQVLTRLGDTVRAHVRQADLPCRYGGEEFVVIMPGADGARAMEVAERIRQAFGQHPVVPRPGVKIHVTVSLGAAQYEAGLTAQDLLERADRAMYRAKAAGKNIVQLWNA
jgi:diguanylate cyclase (GGDEF)-like protein